MLKIKEEVKPEQLEKYGFKYYPNGYFKKVYLANDDDDKVCYRIYDDRSIQITRLDGELDNTLYDLIKADLVEKV